MESLPSFTLSWDCAPFGVPRGFLPPPSLERPPLLGFRSLWRHRSGKFTVHGFTSPATFRLQVFSTSWRFPPPRTLVALFHATDTCGVFPSELSPFKERFRLSTALALLSFLHRSLPSEEGRPSVKAAFRALFPLKVRCSDLLFKLTVARCSPGIQSL
jgi:hypothetical protein